MIAQVFVEVTVTNGPTKDEILSGAKVLGFGLMSEGSGFRVFVEGNDVFLVGSTVHVSGQAFVVYGPTDVRRAGVLKGSYVLGQEDSLTLLRI